MSGWLQARLRNGWTWQLAALWLGLTLAYMLSAPRGITFEDTPLFAGACATLGLPQPPGYPLYVWSCFPLAWLFGAFGWPQVLGVALSSAISTASACVLLAMVIRRVTDTPTLALLAAGLLGLSPSVWDQAQIPEVYGLNLVLLMLCWYFCQRFVEDGKRCWLYALAACTGLGITAHWPLFVLSYPFLLLWLAQAWPRLCQHVRDWRMVSRCLALFALGLLPYAHLLIVSDDAFFFATNYQDSSFFAYVSREVYGLGGSYLPWLPRVAQAAVTSTWFVREYLYLFGMAVPLGLYVLFKRHKYWQLGAVACGMLMTTTVLCLVRPYDTYSEIGTWVFHAYPLAAYAVAALPLALGLSQALAWLRSPLSLQLDKLGNVAVVAAILVGVALWQFPNADRSDEKTAAQYSLLVLQRAPKDALVLNFADDYGFALRYANYFDNSRPDVEVIGEQYYLTDISQGLASAQDEKKLQAERRPVVLLNNLKFSELGMSYHGTHFLLDKSLGAGEISIELDEKGREFLRSVYELGQQGIRNAFTRQFARSTITNFVTVVEAARLHGMQLDIKDLSLLKQLEETPEGMYAKFLAYALESPQGPSVSDMEREVAKLRPYWDSLHASQRSDVLHLLATARLFGDNLAGATDAFRLAFIEFPRAENRRVLIDLLQILASQGDFAQYERMRKRYPTLNAGVALVDYDAKCEELLRRACTISLQ